jgi:hypothetical protein
MRVAYGRQRSLDDLGICKRSADLFNQHCLARRKLLKRHALYFHLRGITVYGSQMNYRPVTHIDPKMSIGDESPKTRDRQ